MERIKLELTESEFQSMVSMIEDNSTMMGCSNKEFADRTQADLSRLQKAFNRNKIIYQFCDCRIKSKVKP